MGNDALMEKLQQLELEKEKLAMDLQFLYRLYENVPEPMILLDRKKQFIQVNPAACRFFEMEKEVLLTKTLYDFLYLSSADFIKKNDEIIGKNGSLIGEIFIELASGLIKQVEFYALGEITEATDLYILKDITSQKRLEWERTLHLKLFNNILNQVIDGIVIFDDNGIITNVNPAFCTSVSMEKETLIGMNMNQLFSKNQIDTKEQFWNQLYEVGSFVGKVKLDLPSGMKVFEMSTSSNVFNGFYLSIMRDITEKLAMENQLRKSDMYNIIGEMAAGIAHEIRNPMTSLKGFIQLLRQNVDDYQMYFDIISSELERIESIVNELLILAKPNSAHYSKNNVSKIMKETMDLMQGQAMLSNIQFKISFEKRLPSIYCEPNHIKQVFINIIKNGMEAMPKGGKIHINIKHAQDGYLVVSIRDEGEGIDKEQLQKLGEPFFTTKARGNGLGLMVSYNIIKEHKGKIVVDSAPNKGTVFSIFLPVAE